MYANQINGIAAQQKASANYEMASGGACLGGSLPSRPLESSLSGLHTMIDRLQDAVYRLQGNLTTVVLPESPSAEKNCVAQATSPVPILQVLDMERDRIESLLRVVESIESRLVL